MKTSVERRALSGSIANVAGIGALLIQNIAIVPVMLRYWGPELYGIWVAINALQSLLQTIDTGQQGYLGNEFNRLYHQDRVRLERLLSTGLCTILLLGFLQLVLVLAIHWGAVLGRLLGLGMDLVNRYSTWWALLALVLGWILSGSVGGLVVRLTYAVGHYARFNWWAVAGRVLTAIGLVVAVRCGAGLLATSIVYSAIQIGINILMLLDMIHCLRQIGIRLRRPSWSLGVASFGKSMLLTTTGLLDGASTSGLFTLVSALLSAAVLPMFSTLRTLANVAMQSVITVINPLYPEISRYGARNEIGKLNEVTAVCWLAAGTIVNVGLLCSIVFVQPVYAIWTHGKLPFHRELFALLAIGVALKAFGAPWIGYLICTNSIKEQLGLTMARGGIALGLTYLLAHSAGLTGVGIAVAASELVASLLLPLVFTHHEFQRRGHAIPWRAFSLACASLLVLAVAFGVADAKLLSPFLTVGLGLIVLGVLAVAQWNILLPETRGRLLSMVLRDRKPPRMAVA